jgi:hypothetical protein
LVVAAAFADGSGSALFAFYAFFALVPVAAVIALNGYGELVESPPAKDEETPRRLQALLWAVLLAFAVLGAASRAPVLGDSRDRLPARPVRGGNRRARAAQPPPGATSRRPASKW